LPTFIQAALKQPAFPGPGHLLVTPKATSIPISSAGHLLVTPKATTAFLSPGNLLVTPMKSCQPYPSKFRN